MIKLKLTRLRCESVNREREILNIEICAGFGEQCLHAQRSCMLAARVLLYTNQLRDQPSEHVLNVMERQSKKHSKVTHVTVSIPKYTLLEWMLHMLKNNNVFVNRFMV